MRGSIGSFVGMAALGVLFACSSSSSGGGGTTDGGTDGPSGSSSGGSSGGFERRLQRRLEWRLERQLQRRLRGRRLRVARRRHRQSLHPAGRSVRRHGRHTGQHRLRRGLGLIGPDHCASGMRGERQDVGGGDDVRPGAARRSQRRLRADGVAVELLLQHQLLRVPRHVHDLQRVEQHLRVALTSSGLRRHALRDMAPAAIASARRGNLGLKPRSSRMRRPSRSASKARARSASEPSGGGAPTDANSVARSGASSSTTL